MLATLSPFPGFGLGFRREHTADFLDSDPVEGVDFVEVISENYMVDGGKPLRILEDIRSRHPVILHGVSLSIGSAHGVDDAYLDRLGSLADRIDPLWVSDHLCWTRTSAHNSHDLLPLPLTREALQVVCDNIDHAQERLGRVMLFENPSSYVTFPQDEMAEWEFLSEMARRTGCCLLLDVNNIFVSAHNHGFDALEYIGGLPLERVRQMHLAGHEEGDIIIDTHDRSVSDGVWTLFAEAIRRLDAIGNHPAIMIERDGNIPPLHELVEELGKARTIAAHATERLAA